MVLWLASDFIFLAIYFHNWYEFVERTLNDKNLGASLIDYYKYLNCKDCKESGLYCPKHRTEVEKILAIDTNC